MRWSEIHRVELNRCLYAPGHTAFKTQGLYCNLQGYFLFGFLYSACGLLNAELMKSTTDFVIYHKIDCAFFPVALFHQMPRTSSSEFPKI